MIYRSIIAGLWLIFVAYWAIAAVDAKRSASRRRWRREIGLRLVVPGRVIAVTTFIQIGVEAAFMLSAASVFERLGSSGLFFVMAGLFIMLLPSLALLPAKWPTATTDDPREPEGPQRSCRAYPLLLSFIPFIVVQAGVYTFLGEFCRVAAHLSVEATLHAIGISVVLSSLGSVPAYCLNDRIGFRLPLGLASNVKCS